MSTSNDCGGTLRERRARAGITRQTLAELANCSVSVLQLMETGYQPKRSEVRDRVERILDALAERDPTK